MICSLSTSWNCRLQSLCSAGFSLRIPLIRAINSFRLSALSRSQCLISYFSELKYSSLTGFEQLERRSVNPVAGSQCRRQNQADHEGWAAAELQILGQNIRRVRPQVGAKVLAHFGLRELLKILRDLGLGVAPGKVAIGLAEAELGQPVHHLGTGERFGKKNHLGVISFHFADQPLPKRQRLGVRVINPKNADSLFVPKFNDTF